MCHSCRALVVGASAVVCCPPYHVFMQEHRHSLRVVSSESPTRQGLADE